MNKIKAPRCFFIFQLFCFTSFLIFLLNCQLYARTEHEKQQTSAEKITIKPTGKIISLDLFESSIIDEGLNDGPSSWYASGGILSQKSNIWGGGSDRKSPEKPGTYAVIETRRAGNYLLSADVRSPEDGAIGIMFCYKDKNNYYRFSIDNQNRYMRFIRKVEGKITILAEKQTLHTPLQWETIQIQDEEETITIFINDRYILHAMDTTFSAGNVGLYCWGNENAEFKNVTVADIKESLSHPGASSEKKANNNTSGNKKKTGSITKISVPAAPATSAMRSGNTLKSDTASLNIKNFTIVDDGKKNGPSSWQVSGRVLTQSSNIWGNTMDPKDPSQPGTYAIYDIHQPETYTLSVDLKSGDDDSIGVLFRYQDVNNYYRFSMNKEQNKQRLIKKINGKTTVIGEKNADYDVEKWYTFKITVNPDQVAVYLDNSLVFKTHDRTLTKGNFGLYCWGNENSQFKDIYFVPDNTSVAPLKATPKKNIKTASVTPDTSNESRNSNNKLPVMSASPTVKAPAPVISISAKPKMAPKETKNPQTDVEKKPAKNTSSKMKKDLSAGPAIPSGSMGTSPATRTVRPKVTHQVCVIEKKSDIDISKIHIIDEGELAAPSSWVFYGEVLLQTSGIWGQSDAKEVFKRGTYAVFKSPVHAADYLVTVDIRSQNKNEIGVMFGYENDANYYRFTMNAESGYRRLLKKWRGKTTVLSEEDKGFDLNRWYTVNARVERDRIVIYLNDDIIFNIKDHAPLSGDYALYCYKNDYTSFKNMNIKTF